MRSEKVAERGGGGGVGVDSATHFFFFLNLVLDIYIMGWEYRPPTIPTLWADSTPWIRYCLTFQVQNVDE